MFRGWPRPPSEKISSIIILTKRGVGHERARALFVPASASTSTLLNLSNIHPPSSLLHPIFHGAFFLTIISISLRIYLKYLQNHACLILKYKLSPTGASPAYASPLSRPSSQAELPVKLQLAWRALDSSSAATINVLTTVKPYQSASAPHTHCKILITTPITIHEH